LYALERFPYSARKFEDQVNFHLGDAIFGGKIEMLAQAFSIAGKSLIEFGPLDGAQTAFLVNQGPARITCIEARPENAIKTIIAKQVFDWKNVDVVMDDFHNVHGSKYGRFDLVFAHGVYYHSIAPFVFLENLISLADNIFLGGFCATDSNPTTDYVQLDYQGGLYRAKQYREAGAADFYAGVNTVGYFFHGDDLLAFFKQREFQIQVFEDLYFGAEMCAGRYLRFFAKRSA
jgi:hypothetical protein